MKEKKEERPKGHFLYVNMKRNDAPYENDPNRKQDGLPHIQDIRL